MHHRNLPNKVVINKVTATIWLRDMCGDVVGKATVDLGDLYSISQYKWYKWRDYAVTHNKGNPIYMHRLIMECSKGDEVDHINGNGLDNRKENLRLCSHKENMYNMKTRKDNKSGYRGVSWEKKRQCWVAMIWWDKKQHFLGYFDTPEEAAHVYNRFSVEKHGEFGRLNMVKSKGKKGTQGITCPNHA